MNTTSNTLTIQPSVRGRSGTSSGIAPTAEQQKVAHDGLVALNAKGANTTQLVEYLLNLGWNVSSICSMIRYPSDSTRENGHKAGDKLLPQHVNHIKTRWLANKATEAAKATKAPAVDPVKEPAATELRKS